MSSKLQCLLLKNDCYAKYHGVSFEPQGIAVHSSDKAGKVISRFVQPYAGQVDGLMINGKAVSETEMRSVLGKNKYNNDWNRPGVEKAVHAMLGTLDDGSYGVCQTLDWTQPCWGCGSGKNGSYNGCYGGKAAEPLYIQFEMIEDSESDPVHATNLYWLAVEFCAELMRQFPTIRLENVVSHKEAHERGFASDHGDPENYWKRCGKDYTMDVFRADVQARLNPPQPEPEPLPFTDVSPENWSYDDIKWAYDNGIVKGKSATVFGRKEPCTREQVCAIFHRYDIMRFGG